jgi:hypothetical protein
MAGSDFTDAELLQLYKHPDADLSLLSKEELQRIDTLTTPKQTISEPTTFAGGALKSLEDTAWNTGKGYVKGLKGLIPTPTNVLNTIRTVTNPVALMDAAKGTGGFVRDAVTGKLDPERGGEALAGLTLAAVGDQAPAIVRGIKSIPSVPGVGLASDAARGLVKGGAGAEWLGSDVIPKAVGAFQDARTARAVADAAPERAIPGFDRNLPNTSATGTVIRPPVAQPIGTMYSPPPDAPVATPPLTRNTPTMAGPTGSGVRSFSPGEERGIAESTQFGDWLHGTNDNSPPIGNGTFVDPRAAGPALLTPQEQAFVAQLKAQGAPSR